MNLVQLPHVSRQSTGQGKTGNSEPEHLKAEQGINVEGNQTINKTDREPFNRMFKCIREPPDDGLPCATNDAFFSAESRTTWRNRQRPRPGACGSLESMKGVSWWE